MDILTKIDRITVDDSIAADARRVIAAEGQVVRSRRAEVDRAESAHRAASVAAKRGLRAYNAAELRAALAEAEERAFVARARVADAEREARRVVALWGLS
jgi:hypothetical protein